MKTLVVDDDAVFREELSEFLLSEGHESLTAPSVGRALEMLQNDWFDLIFTDLKMPRQTGLELLAEVRRHWPQTFVVIVTGFATINTAVEAMKMGAFDYVAKPFRTAQIRAVLQLVREESAFSSGAEPDRTPRSLAGHLAERDGVPVLLATDGPPSKSPKVETFPFDGRDPSRLRDAVQGFLDAHPSGGLVIGEADRMLQGHHLEDVTGLLQSLRDRLQAAGPFAVGFDPEKVTRAQAEALRALMAGPQVHGALEALTNPIRRRILARLEKGPASFTETMKAAGIDDSPKLTFHVHRLVDEQLIGRTGQDYSLTPKGRDAVALLHEMERVGAEKGRRQFVFVAHSARGNPQPPGPPR